MQGQVHLQNLEISPRGIEEGEGKAREARREHDEGRRPWDLYWCSRQIFAIGIRRDLRSTISSAIARGGNEEQILKKTESSRPGGDISNMTGVAATPARLASKVNQEALVSGSGSSISAVVSVIYGLRSFQVHIGVY